MQDNLTAEQVGNIYDKIFDFVSDELSNDEAIRAIYQTEAERFGISNDCDATNIVRWGLK